MLEEREAFCHGDGSEAGSAGAREVQRSKRTVRIGVIFVLLAGLSVSTGLVAYYSLPEICGAIWRIGWRLSLIVVVHIAAVVLCGLAWRVLFGSGSNLRSMLLISLRWIRESVNALLPVARVGGDVIGARLLVIRGARPSVAGASIVVDRTAEILSQFFFSAAGVVVLIGQGTNPEFANWAILGLIVMFLLFISFFLAQRLGLMRIIETLVLRIVQRWKGAPVIGNGSIQDALWAIYRDGWRFSVSTSFHALGWVLGVVQIYLAMHFMGHPIGWAGAFVVESLSQIICTAAFIMPAALGAQEAGYMAVGRLVGIPPEMGLALSLVKRVGDVTVGIPGLLFWQWLEGRRLWALWTDGRNKIKHYSTGESHRI